MPGAEVGHQVLHLEAGQRVECGEGLVEQEEPGFARQGPGQGHALGLAARQRAGPGVGTLLETDLAQRVDGRRAGRRRLGEPVTTVRQTRMDATRRGPSRRRSGLRHQHLAGRRRLEARRMRSSVVFPLRRAQQRHELAPGDGDVEAVEHPRGGEGPANPEGDGGRGRGDDVHRTALWRRQGLTNRSRRRTRRSAAMPRSASMMTQTTRTGICWRLFAERPGSRCPGWPRCSR